MSFAEKRKQIYLGDDAESKKDNRTMDEIIEDTFSKHGITLIRSSETTDN